MNKSPEVSNLVDHLFRHETGKLTAVLTRIFGPHNMELAEDYLTYPPNNNKHTCKKSWPILAA